jgi:hypothetical protein
MPFEEVGSYEAYKGHLFEASAAKWFRNITGLGFAATTALINFKAELMPVEHVEVTAVGLAFAVGSAWALDRDRRQAIHDAHLNAAFAHIHANLNGEPIPDWAVGNTGNIFVPRHEQLDSS